MASPSAVDPTAVVRVVDDKIVQHRLQRGRGVPEVGELDADIGRPVAPGAGRACEGAVCAAHRRVVARRPAA